VEVAGPSVPHQAFVAGDGGGGAAVEVEGASADAGHADVAAIVLVGIGFFEALN